MKTDIVTTIVIGGILNLIFIVMAVLLLRGKGGFLIAGYNTMPKEEQKKWDAPKLCKFMGKLMLGFVVTLNMIFVGAIFELDWLASGGGLLTVAFCIFAVIWANTGNRFIKKR